jgi:hypothetical protein
LWAKIIEFRPSGLKSGDRSSEAIAVDGFRAIRSCSAFASLAENRRAIMKTFDTVPGESNANIISSIINLVCPQCGGRMSEYQCEGRFSLQKLDAWATSRPPAQLRRCDGVQRNHRSSWSSPELRQRNQRTGILSGPLPIAVSMSRRTVGNHFSSAEKCESFWESDTPEHDPATELSVQIFREQHVLRHRLNRYSDIADPAIAFCPSLLESPKLDGCWAP